MIKPFEHRIAVGSFTYRPNRDGTVTLVRNDTPDSSPDPCAAGHDTLDDDGICPRCGKQVTNPRQRRDEPPPPIANPDGQDPTTGRPR